METMYISCNVCDTYHAITAPASAIADYSMGALVQDAFPMLTADERELLISGTCGVCFDLMFGGEE